MQNQTVKPHSNDQAEVSRQSVPRTNVGKGGEREREREEQDRVLDNCFCESGTAPVEIIRVKTETSFAISAITGEKE